MSDEKEPSKEALAFLESLFEGWPVAQAFRKRSAHALEACVEALLKRQEQAELQVFVNFKRDLAAEKAAHAATRAELGATKAELTDALAKAGRATARHERCVAESDLAHAELNATRKELALETKGRGEYREQIDVLIGEREALRAARESLRKPLEGELAEDVALLRSSCEWWYGGDGVVAAKSSDGKALDRIDAALRAKGGAAEDERMLREQFAASASRLGGELAAMRARLESERAKAELESLQMSRLHNALLELYEAAKKCDPALTDVALDEPGRSIARAAELVTELLAKGEPNA